MREEMRALPVGQPNPQRAGAMPAETSCLRGEEIAAMGNRGRYGKYGEQKRIRRLREGAAWAARLSGRPPFAPESRPPATKRDASRAGLSTRQALPSDAGFVRSLSRVFRPYGPYEEILSRWFQTGAALVRIGLKDRTPAGFVMLGPVSAPGGLPGVCELLAIAVSPAARRRGLARVMLQEAECLAAQLGAEALLLHTSVDNGAAQGLFRKCGFSRVVLRGKFYPEGQDAFCMIKELDPGLPGNR